MLNALAGSIPPRECGITCEKVFELAFPYPVAITASNRYMKAAMA